LLAAERTRHAFREPHDDGAPALEVIEPDLAALGGRQAERSRALSETGNHHQTPLITVADLAEERKHEERVGAPAGRLLHLTAPCQPRLRFRLVAALDRERGETFVAGKQELRLADGFGDRERALVVVGARLVIASALVHLREDDQRDR